MCIKNPTPLQTRKVIRDLQRRFQILLWTQTEVKVKVEPLKIHASNYKRIPEPQNLLRVVKICTLMLRKTTRLINTLCLFNLQLRWNKSKSVGWKSAPTRAYQAPTKWHTGGKSVTRYQQLNTDNTCLGWCDLRGFSVVLCFLWFVIIFTYDQHPHKHKRWKGLKTQSRCFLPESFSFFSSPKFYPNKIVLTLCESHNYFTNKFLVNFLYGS